jgi:hypothetical protein
MLPNPLDVNCAECGARAGQPCQPPLTGRKCAGQNDTHIKRQDQAVRAQQRQKDAKSWIPI